MQQKQQRLRSRKIVVGAKHLYQTQERDSTIANSSRGLTPLNADLNKINIDKLVTPSPDKNANSRQDFQKALKQASSQSSAQGM